MRLRLLFFGALAAASVSFAACSSGATFTPNSNSTAQTPSQSHIAPTGAHPATTLPTPAPELHLAGREWQAFTYKYGFPSPQPPIEIVSKINDLVSAIPATPPPGLPSAITTNVQVLEKATTSLQQVTTWTYDYVAINGSDLFGYAKVSNITAPTYAQSSQTVTIFGSPQQETGAIGTTWKNTPERAVHETYSDGHYEDRSVASNGTYTETGTTYNLNGTLAKIQINEMASGAGSYMGPFEGTPSNTSFSFSAPKGTPAQIAITLFLNGQKIPQGSIPSWFGQPPPLWVERSFSRTATAPKECGAFAGKPAILDRRFQRTVDTIIGYVDIYEVKTYSDASGPMCIFLDDFIDNYYNWQGDSTAFLIVSPDDKPISTINTLEDLVRTSGSLPEARISPQAAAALEAGAESHFKAKIEAVHAKLRAAMLNHLAHFNGGAR